MNEIEVPQQRQESVNAVAVVNGWKVKTVEDRTALDGFLVGLSGLEKLISKDFEKSRAAATEAFNAAKAATSAVKAQEEGHLKPVQDARRLGKQKLFAFDEDQERIRKQKEAELQAQANKLAEEQQLQEAEFAEASGDNEAATAIINQPVQAAVVSLPKVGPKSQTVIAKRPFVTIVDHVKVNRAYTIPDQVLIGQLVRSRAKDRLSADAIEVMVGGIKIDFRAV